MPAETTITGNVLTFYTSPQQQLDWLTSSRNRGCQFGFLPRCFWHRAAIQRVVGEIPGPITSITYLAKEQQSRLFSECESGRFGTTVVHVYCNGMLRSIRVQWSTFGDHVYWDIEDAGIDIQRRLIPPDTAQAALTARIEEIRLDEARVATAAAVNFIEHGLQWRPPRGARSRSWADEMVWQWMSLPPASVTIRNLNALETEDRNASNNQ